MIEKLREGLLAEMNQMSISMYNKRTHWSYFLWATLDWCLKKIGHQGILDHFTTVIGRGIYIPGVWALDSLEILAHEMQHLREKYTPGISFWKRIGWDLSWLLSKQARRDIECRGFIRNIEAAIVVNGLNDIESLHREMKPFLMRYLTDISYFYLMSEASAKSWVEEIIPWVLYQTADGKRLLPKNLPLIPGMTTKILY